MSPSYFLILFILGYSFQLFGQTDSTLLRKIDSLASLKAQVLLKQKLDSMKARNEKPPRKIPVVTFQIIGNSQLNTGNVQRTLFSSTGRIQVKGRSRFYKLYADATYLYGEKSQVISENDLTCNLNHSFWYEKRFYGIAFGTYEFSNLRGIFNRYLGGVGVGCQLVNIAPEKAKSMLIVPYVSVTNSLLYESTDFRQAIDVEVWRNSTRFLANFTCFKGKLILNNTVFLQPSLNNNNFRASWNNILRVPLSAWFSLQSTLDYSYESVVLLGRQNSDVRLLFGFTFGTM
jgi:Protein of unknown function, DUF481